MRESQKYLIKKSKISEKHIYLIYFLIIIQSITYISGPLETSDDRVLDFIKILHHVYVLDWKQ